MSRSRIRRAWLTACTAATLTLTGLTTPAQAEEPTPPSATDSTIQEPRAQDAPAPTVGAQAWSGPGGPASSAGFTLAAGAMNAETSRRVARLDAVLPKQGVQNLLAAANRDMAPWCAERDPFGSAPDPEIKYCLQNDDSISREWIPQAITGVSDAMDNEKWGEAENILLFGSYDGWDPGRDSNDNGVGDCNEEELAKEDACNQKGVRVTFSQSRINPATSRPEIKYRHVLLAWAYENSADHISYDAVHAKESTLQKGVHAGGMVWYGNYLYLADTRNGIRVFDMRKIMDLDPDGDPSTRDKMGADTDGVNTTSNVQDKTKIGRHNNVWYSFGYRYVMPQVAAWTFKAPQQNPKGSYACTDTNAPKASYLSLDRSTVPDRLIMGEYCRPEAGYPSTGRVSSYPVAALEARSGEVAAEGWANYLPKEGIQGFAAHNGDYYFNQSTGPGVNGNLWRATRTDGKLVARTNPVKTATGPEDLYIERGKGRLWSVSEHSKTAKDLAGESCTALCERVLYGYKLDWLQAQP
ncbi:hypothetical protein ACH44C_21260 [Streptomyces purpureus]|uniref:hypothetical protein n=1 Tax=Streptomyces purpureus TaxID=1951 RepID=UPI003790F9B6